MTALSTLNPLCRSSVMEIAMNAMTIPRAPRNLAEALDALQPFLPTDRTLHIVAYRTGVLAGRNFVHVTSGANYADEVSGSSGGSHYASLSDALVVAEADHATKHDAKYGKAAAAEAEFGPHCPAIVAYQLERAMIAGAK